MVEQRLLETMVEVAEISLLAFVKLRNEIPSKRGVSRLFGAPGETKEKPASHWGMRVLDGARGGGRTRDQRLMRT